MAILDAGLLAREPMLPFSVAWAPLSRSTGSERNSPRHSAPEHPARNSKTLCNLPETPKPLQLNCVWRMSPGRTQVPRKAAKCLPCDVNQLRPRTLGQEKLYLGLIFKNYNQRDTDLVKTQLYFKTEKMNRVY